MSDYIVTARNQDGYGIDHALLNTDGAISITFNNVSVSTPILPAGSWYVTTTAPCWIARSPAAGMATTFNSLLMPAAGGETGGPIKTLPGDYLAILGYNGASGLINLVPYVTQG